MEGEGEGKKWEGKGEGGREMKRGGDENMDWKRVHKSQGCQGHTKCSKEIHVWGEVTQVCVPCVCVCAMCDVCVYVYVPMCVMCVCHVCMCV